MRPTKRLLVIAALVPAIFASKIPEVCAFEAILSDLRVAETAAGGGGVLSTGGRSTVLLLQGRNALASGPPLDPLAVGPRPDSWIVEVQVCDPSNVCDSGSIFTAPSGVGPMWMDPLLEQASFTITVPSLSGRGGTLTASVTFTGDPGLPTPFVGTPTVLPGIPILVDEDAGLGRGATVAGTVSATLLGYSDTFVAGTRGNLSEAVLGFVLAP